MYLSIVENFKSGQSNWKSEIRRFLHERRPVPATSVKKCDKSKKKLRITLCNFSSLVVTWQQRGDITISVFVLFFFESPVYQVYVFEVLFKLLYLSSQFNNFLTINDDELLMKINFDLIFCRDQLLNEPCKPNLLLDVADHFVYTSACCKFEFTAVCCDLIWSLLIGFSSFWYRF